LVLIACSGDVPDDPAATVLAAGFDAFLDKPVDIRRLLATIESARGARRAAPD
jgi:CheY-like chemotaxis protein